MLAYHSSSSSCHIDSRHAFDSTHKRLSGPGRGGGRTVSRSISSDLLTDSFLEKTAVCETGQVVNKDGYSVGVTLPLLLILVRLCVGVLSIRIATYNVNDKVPPKGTLELAPLVGEGEDDLLVFGFQEAGKSVGLTARIGSIEPIGKQLTSSSDLRGQALLISQGNDRAESWEIALLNGLGARASEFEKVSTRLGFEIASADTWSSSCEPNTLES